ncbi:recombination protein O N-terminal domain-containing protein [Candidatus Peregrinibacteria bacterium]|nr:recombination protein O N-terminal domain-containing protein [Candidatus Peregrinibacteria bacterium]
MSYTRPHDALVLQTHDVGEADRFCILFTREAGRKAARAKGVRKLGSTMGGLLLPLRRVKVELRDHGDASFITSVIDADNAARPSLAFRPFARIAEGIELLLRLTEDDEPMPRVFDLLLELRDACVAQLPEPVIPFQLRLLHLLGLLPMNIEDRRFAHLSGSSQIFLQSCVSGHALPVLCGLPADHKELKSFCTLLLHDHLTMPLRAGRVAEEMGANCC